MKKLIYLLSVIAIPACLDNARKIANPLSGKVFYRITQTDSTDILFQYCDASINTIKVYKDSIFEDIGQEYYTMNIDRIVHQQKFLYFGSDSPLDIYSFLMKDSIKNYWIINDNMYIDSLYANTLPFVEQPCLECFEKEICDALESQEKLEKENFKTIEQIWQGNYTFNLEGVEHMGETHSAYYTFRITKKPEMTFRLDDNQKINTPVELMNVAHDTLAIKPIDSNEEYIFIRHEDGSFSIGGHTIYMLNPPNDMYPLTKEK